MTDAKVRELRGIMLAKGVSVADMAQAMGIHSHTLYMKLEKKRNFSRPEMDAIHKVLDLSDKQMMSIFFS